MKITTEPISFKLLCNDKPIENYGKPTAKTNELMIFRSRSVNLQGSQSHPSFYQENTLKPLPDKDLNRQY